MIAAGFTDVGRIRQMNEDSYSFHVDMEGCSFAIVADGMGGHQAGEIASTMAVEVVQEYLQSTIHVADADHRECLYEAIEKANERIYDYSLKHASMIGMGTTIVVSIISQHRIVVAHVGDSRLYLIRNGNIEAVTLDHSHVQNLVNQGIITYEEARLHPKRNIILRALGTESTVEIDVHDFDWLEGDVALLCSDGLSNMLNDQRIVDIINQSLSPEQLVRQLIDEANDAGGDDNITAILLQNSRIEGSDDL
jgi:serine/threonine protein phosphatase PrpC